MNATPCFPPNRPPVTSIATLRTAALALMTMALLSLDVVHVAVQQPPDLFAGQVLHRIDVYLNSDDWRDLQANTATRSYHPATLKWGTVVARNVGIRSDSPRDVRKPRLYIDTAWFVSGLTFQGLQSLTLDNLADDASGIRRIVTTSFYERMGLAAPRAAHVVLYVNNAFAGLYAIVESMDGAFLRSAAISGQEPGRLYRYTSRAPYRLDYLGSDLNMYRELFRATQQPVAFPAEDYATIEEMLRALNSGVIAADEPRLAKYVDVRLFMKLAAVQNFLGEPDGVLGRDGMSNFSVNVRGRTDAVRFVTNGESRGLLDANYPIEQGLTGNALTRQAVRIRALSQVYLDTLLASANEAERRDGLANSVSWLEAEMGRHQRLIADTVKSDSFKLWTDGEIQSALERVTWFVRERASFVRCEVARLLHSGGACRTEPPVGEVRQNAVSAPALSTRQRSTGLSGPVTNIARGRPYTLAPRPSYPLTSDAGDDIQLTDGAFSVGTPLWTRATAVGWVNAAPVTIVIDLGSIQPIAGVSFSTAAGTAGVLWPRSIFVMVSDDGRQFFSAGDLAAVPGAVDPPSTGYAAFRFVTADLSTHGRYVAFIVDPTGPFTFCDEIEVFAGDPAWLRSTLSGDSTTDLQKFFVDAHMRVSIQRRLAADLGTARTALEASQVSAAVRALSARELDIAESEIGAVPLRQLDSFRAVLPLNATHASIFAVHGLIRQANGLPSLSAWVVNPWDFVRPIDPPPTAADGPGTLSIAAMVGETRSGALNVSNSTGRPMTVILRLSGLPDTAQGSDLRLYESVWTDTRELIPVADALIPLSDGNASFNIPAGMTRQIWFSFTPSDRAPGTSRGVLQATADDGFRVNVPMELRVLSGRFPEQPRLHLGGWDYTDAEKIYGLTATNREALIRQLQRLKVDSPWATSSAMPFGSYDTLGRLNVLPDTSRFDRWVSRWPGASRYLVFVNAPETLGNVAISDSRFPTAAAQWIKFWVAHALALGIRPSQLMLLLVDEPRAASQDGRVVIWARAIKAGDPGVRIWENPTYTDPAGSKPQLLDVSDILALKRSLIAQQGAPYVDFYQQRRARGQTLDVFGAAGPARLLDPYTYYRLQAWVCAHVGASGSFFWSFVDDAGGSSWNEYGTTAATYDPLFLSVDAVTSSKHVEAIREGVEDFEYLAMLRDRVDELGRSDPNHAGLSEARTLLENGVTLVLNAPGATEMQWVPDKDRSVAERVRLSVADLLDLLRR